MMGATTSITRPFHLCPAGTPISPRAGLDPSPQGEGGAAGAGWGSLSGSDLAGEGATPPDLAGREATLPLRGGIAAHVVMRVRAALLKAGEHHA
ncbi:hypothetical protein [Chelatococcus asaccharovorans]|uniref:Uncharacterized protein n=1 Tax=Chelatococcus asaccharovorans TaxID=28210 RepID=A0A2V3U1B9_9HYPH|nr:hypothetical protein [Chelatococcus asaccharovorans]MBS7704312.1 hypothetical protein [Chelatococcus asaccharovorans]PXW55811.1 hypothetical protein C7450_109223 [Chelatococcus asaccharovorans]